MRLDQYSLGSYHPGASLIRQLLWYYLGDLLVQTPLLPFSSLKVLVLRLFGAQVGRGVTIKPFVKIKFPWRLKIYDHVWLGERCWIDNVAEVTIESHVCISQNAYLCTGNHDWGQATFNLIPRPIYIESSSWIGANSVVGPGIRIQTGAVLSLGAVATRSLEAMTVYGGNPCQALKKRKIQQMVDKVDD